MRCLLRIVGGVCVLALSACGGGGDDEEPANDAGSTPTVLDGGGTIPDPPNGEALCQSGACNYQTQDCTGDQSCLPALSPPASGDWPPACQAAGTVAAGQPCTQWNECVKGAFCAGLGQDSGGGVTAGTCLILCCGGDWSACPTGQSCIQQLYLLRPGGTDPVYAGADVCAPVGTCDVLKPDSCPDPNRTCQIVDPTGNVACAPAGAGAPGEPCSTVKPCQSGLSCVGGECRRLCKAVEGEEPSCPPGEGVCVHFARDPEGVGECTVLQQ
jgi:hypothetical protein